MAKPNRSAQPARGAGIPPRGVPGALRGIVLAVATWTLLGAVGLTGIFKLWEFEGLAIAAAVGAALGMIGRTGPLWLLQIVCAVPLLVASVTAEPLRPAVRRLVRHDSLPAGGVEAVVVLSSQVNADGRLDASGTDRLLGGLDVVQRTRAPRLVITRVQSRGRPAIASDADQERLIRLVGTRAKWIVTPLVRTTRDEAREVAAIAKREGFSRIAVVTAPLHTRRACGVFERAGLAVTCVPAPSHDAALRALSTSQDRVRVLRQVAYEAAGFAWYAVTRD
jgi:uncharacterized SAM-binding protein YcdF (DUF218 family)